MRARQNIVSDSGETHLVVFVAQVAENGLQPWQLNDLLLTTLIAYIKKSEIHFLD